MDDRKNTIEVAPVEPEELEEDIIPVEDVPEEVPEMEGDFSKTIVFSKNEIPDTEEKPEEDADSEPEREGLAKQIEDEVKSREEKKREKRQKKRVRKRRVKKIAGPAIAILIVLAIGLVIFARSDFFLIDSIKVAGNDYYTKAQVKEICGAEKGVNIFSVHKKAMIKLLVNDPYIADAEIEKKLPSTLIIRIVESEERGAVFCDKNYYVMDSSGYVLRVTTEKPKEIPVITGFTVRRGEEGEALEIQEAKSFNNTLSLINASAKSTISYTSIKVKNNVCYAYIKKKLFIKGLPEDIEHCIKSGKMEAVLYDIYEKGIKHGRISVGKDDYCVFRP